MPEYKLLVGNNGTLRQEFPDDSAALERARDLADMQAAATQRAVEVWRFEMSGSVAYVGEAAP